MKSEKAEALTLDNMSKIQKLIDRGISVWKAEFHAAVNNSDEIPETFFSNRSAKKERHVTMWWINGDGLLCLHKGKYFIVPTSTVRYADFE